MFCIDFDPAYVRCSVKTCAAHGALVHPDVWNDRPREHDPVTGDSGRRWKSPDNEVQQ